MISSWVVVLIFGMLIGCIVTGGALRILDGRWLRKMTRSSWEAERMHREYIADLDRLVEKAKRKPIA